MSGLCFAQSKWELVSPIAEVTDIIYAQNLYVAATGNSIITSKDGKKWVNNPLNDKIRAIAYGNGKFVAFASEGDRTVIYTSSDGENWSEAFQKEFKYEVVMLDIFMSTICLLW